MCIRDRGDTVQLELCLPAAQELNLNPSLLTGFLEEKFGLPAASANICLLYTSRCV